MSVWPGSVFVVDWSSVPLVGILPPWITRLFVQVASGLQPSPLMPPWDWFETARRNGWTVDAWAWCDGQDPEAEGAFHAEMARSIGASAFVANMETAYSAAGNQADPRFHMPGRYLAYCDWPGPLGVTTHPDFGSDMTPWQHRGAVYMPQAFPGENGKDVSFVVQHGQAWGWDVSAIRPLVQTYPYPGDSGPRADCVELDVQADLAGVGLIPYPIERATLDELEDLRPAIERDTIPASDGGEQPVPDWWTIPYPKAKKPAYDGPMPRPLYPPDAAAQGKRPSVDGEDVLAVKFAVKRAQRWAKDKTREQLDDTFSNGFSHGTGGNVAETGLAGFQRQQHIDATGWMGSKTFDALNWALVPTGPNEGQPLFDAYAVEQLQRAWDRFQGSEPPPPPEKTVRQAALDKAIGQLGYKESPAGSNQNKYGDWYGMNGEPWCAMFVTWCYELNAVGPSQAFVKGSRYAYCPYIVADARAGKYGLRTTDDPIPGDLVLYDWAWDTVYDHIGIFEGWLGGIGEFTCIEGNTSIDNNSNGGQVMRRERSRSDASIVFVRVTEP